MTFDTQTIYFQIKKYENTIFENWVGVNFAPSVTLARRDDRAKVSLRAKKTLHPKVTLVQKLPVPLKTMLNSLHSK